MIPAPISTRPRTAVDRSMRHHGYVWKIAFTAALGGLLFGYDWVVIGGAKHFYEIYFHIHSDWLIGWANSCALLGCLGGCLVAGVLSDKLGRKRMLSVSAVLFAVSSVLTGWAVSLASFVAWRIVGGVAIGLASNVAPTYIAEISPASSRGRLVSLNQFTIVIGILLAQIVNWLIADRIGQSNLAWNAGRGWRWMFTAVAVPAVIFFMLSLGLPESPRWLCMKGKSSMAQRILERIGGKSYAEDEIAEILAASRPDAPLKKLFSSGIRKLTVIACLLAVLQQWCGVNVLFNYADEIYRAAGYNISQVLFNIVITGAVNLLATLVAMAVIDRLGRRSLMLFGCFGIGAAQLLAAIAYSRHMVGTSVLLLTLAAIACYAASLAPVTWVLLTELFPTQMRSKGVSLAASCLWIASFFVTYSFPLIGDRFGMSRVFLLYAIVCACGGILVKLFVPETKGRTLEQLGSVLATSSTLADAP